MNTEHPHEIVRVPPGEKLPKKYVPLTEEEARFLEGLSPKFRALWIETKVQEGRAVLSAEARQAWIDSGRATERLVAREPVTPEELTVWAKGRRAEFERRFEQGRRRGKGRGRP